MPLSPKYFIQYYHMNEDEINMIIGSAVSNLITSKNIKAC
jgi:hypothetical protein